MPVQTSLKILFTGTDVKVESFLEGDGTLLPYLDGPVFPQGKNEYIASMIFCFPFDNIPRDAKNFHISSEGEILFPLNSHGDNRQKLSPGNETFRKCHVRVVVGRKVFCSLPMDDEYESALLTPLSQSD